MMHNVVYTDLPNTYVDIDYLMERALVALLNRYVEIEHRGYKNYLSYIQELLSDSACEKEYFTELQILTLYKWFKRNKDEENEEVITEKLVELVKLRGSLWT